VRNLSSFVFLNVGFSVGKKTNVLEYGVGFSACS